MSDDGKRDDGGGLLEQAKGLAKRALVRAAEKLTGLPLTEPPAARSSGSSSSPTASTSTRPEPSSSSIRPPEPEPTPEPAPEAPPEPPPIVAAQQPAPPKPMWAPEEPYGILDLEEPPETYSVEEVTVLARDPHTLFAYWEVTAAGWDRARAHLGGDGNLTLRLFAVRARPEGGVESTTHDFALSWDHGRRYLPAPAPGAAVSAAVGLLSADGRFAPIAQAPRVRVPPAEPGPEGPVEWMEVAPARARGARIEPPEIGPRGPARPEGGRVPGALPRWQEGGWQHVGGSRVPLKPGEGGLPSESEMPSSPWRWLKPKDE